MLSASKCIRLHKIAGIFFSAGVICIILGAAAPAGRSVSIVNSTRTAMVSLQIRQSGADSWQPDALGSRPLGVQKQISVDLPDGNCFYDVVCRFEDGHRQSKMHVNLCKTPRFVVTNF